MLSKRYRDPISVLYRFDMADVQLLNALLDGLELALGEEPKGEVLGVRDKTMQEVTVG